MSSLPLQILCPDPPLLFLAHCWGGGLPLWLIRTFSWPHKVKDRLPVPTGVESPLEEEEDSENYPQAELVACHVEKDDFIIVVFEFGNESLLLGFHHR